MEYDRRHSAAVKELPNKREGSIDEDESDNEIEEDPLQSLCFKDAMPCLLPLTSKMAGGNAACIF